MIPSVLCSFILALLLSLCLSPLSLAIKHGDRLSTQRAGLYWLPLATEALDNGIRPTISLDVNFIVNNYESTREPVPLGQHLHAAC